MNPKTRGKADGNQSNPAASQKAPVINQTCDQECAQDRCGNASSSGFQQPRPIRPSLEPVRMYRSANIVANNREVFPKVQIVPEFIDRLLSLGDFWKRCWTFEPGRQYLLS